MTVHHYPASESDDRSSLLPYVLVAGSLLLVALGFYLLRPVHRYPRSLQARTDAQTVSSAAIQYMIDNLTCPKGVELRNAPKAA